MRGVLAFISNTLSKMLAEDSARPAISDKRAKRRHYISATLSNGD